MENVKIVRSSRRRSVGIQVTSASSITVTIPYFFPKFFVNKILKEKEDWIRQKQQALATKAQLKPKNTYFFLGKRYELGTRQQKEMVEVQINYIWAEVRNIQRPIL